MTGYHEAITLPGRKADLARVIDFIELSCARAGVTPAASFDLQLATEEACANVIQHAYNGTGGQFEVHFDTRDRDVLIRIHDYGRAFDPNSITQPDLASPLEERPLGGLGLHLIKNLMDEIRFTFSPEEGNTVTMVKRGIVTEQPEDG